MYTHVYMRTHIYIYSFFNYYKLPKLITFKVIDWNFYSDLILIEKLHN